MFAAWIRQGGHKRTVFAPAYTLVGSQDLMAQLNGRSSDPMNHSSVLFVSYCLSQNQKWLLAAFTDEQGGLLDQTIINIQVPASFFTDLETRRGSSSSSDTPPVWSPRHIGLVRLWDYTISLLSRTSNSWRLVIGRVGRLGHGELKGESLLPTR